MSDGLISSEFLIPIVTASTGPIGALVSAIGTIFYPTSIVSMQTAQNVATQQVEQTYGEDWTTFLWIIGGAIGIYFLVQLLILRKTLGEVL